jgi:hypothetical protein
MKTTRLPVRCQLAFFLVLVWWPSAALSQTNAVPLINQPLVPAAAAPGGAVFTLTVNGSGFVNGSTIFWNSSARHTRMSVPLS